MALSTGAASAATAGSGAAWVWGDNPDATETYTPIAGYVYNSAGKQITITPVSTGVFKVNLPGLKTAAPSNVVVSSYGNSGYCTVQNWDVSTATGSVRVRCFDKDGKPANLRYTMLFQSQAAPFGDNSTGLAFVLADQPKADSYTPAPAYSYNSTGGTNTITRQKRGRYTVNIPGLTTIGGTVMVSAYGPNPARCKVASWGQDANGTNAEIYCFDEKGAAGDAQFTMIYSRKSEVVHADHVFGVYTYGNKPDQSDYTAPKTYSYNGVTGQDLTVHHAGFGQYSVGIPGLSATGPSNMLVTAVGTDNVYCNVVGWTPLVTQCYAQGANGAESRFTTAFQAVNPK